MDVTNVRICGASVAVAAKIDGDFDKAGLPDPLVLTY
jgi:hypothetical protein